MPARVLFVALDACDVTVARQLADSGRMPHLARLWSEGVRVPTEPPPGGVFISAIWPTLFLARRPINHRYLCWLTIDPETGEYRYTSPREARGTPFWETLSASGRRLAVLDVPHSWAARELNGIQLVEWAAHDRHFGLDSWPPDLADEVVAHFGLHSVAGEQHNEVRQFAPCDWVHGGWDGMRQHNDARALRNSLVTGIEQKRALSLHFLEREPWDLFLTVIGETHCVGHHFWFLHDAQHERYDAELAGELVDPVSDIYAAADKLIGEHLEAAGNDAHVLVLLGHGMQAHRGGNHLLEHVLAVFAAAWSGEGSTKWWITLAKRAWRALPIGMRRRMHPVVARLVRHLRVPAPPPEPSHRRTRPFFAFPNNDLVGGVRLNLRGRDAGGILDSSARDVTLERLRTELLDLIELRGGFPAIESVRRVESVYPGTRDAPDFPDLYVEWNLTAPIEELYSPTLGTIRVPYTHVRTGDHHPHGVLLVRAPGLAGGRELAATGVENIAPTIAALLGVELPDVDGSPITELLPD